MQKRVAGNWLLAAIIVVARFFVSLVIGLVILVPLFIKGLLAMNIPSLYSNMIVQILGEIGQTFTFWWGAKLGCQYIKKTYVCFDSRRVLQLATLYMVYT